jgi:hypothetical protein
LRVAKGGAMPSPFPGMDPYLESPDSFTGLRFGFVVCLSRTLLTVLPERYYSIIHHRAWIEGDEEKQESFVGIHTVQDERPLVTVLEVLSHAVKAVNLHARTNYLRNREEWLDRGVHLVEIDLLRGQPSTAVTYNDAVAKAGPFDYHICVRKMDDPQHFFVYPIRLKERLPEIAIPLLPGDADVKIDLQAVFDRCYDTGPYRRNNPYLLRPDPPLTPEQAAWAEQLLRDKGQLPPAGG